MRILPTLLSLLILLPSALSHAQPPNTLSAQEQADGWQLLFDGSDISQWRTYQEEQANPAWQAVDGVLFYDGEAGGDLITRRTFADFELTLDWKISHAGNSGIFILADESAGRIYRHAPEVQILDNEHHSDNKKDNHLAGSLYDMVAPPASAQQPSNTWNRCRIRHLQGQLTIWHNDAMVTDLQIGGEQWQRLLAASKFKNWDGFGDNSNGHIGLQDHGDPVQFRNIKIRELETTQ